MREPKLTITMGRDEADACALSLLRALQQLDRGLDETQTYWLMHMIELLWPDCEAYVKQVKAENKNQ